MPPLNQAQISEILTLINSGQHEKAVAVTKRLADKNPNSAVLHVLLGVGHMQMGKLAPAVTSYKKALALEPNNFDALSNIGIALRKQGALSDAEKYYERARALQPNNPDLLYNFALLRESQDQLADAVDIYLKVLSLAPKSADVLNNLGNAYYKLSRFTEAAETLSSAHALQPQNLAFLQNLGLALEAQGASEKLLEVDQKISALDPDHMLKLGSFAINERTSAKPATSTLHRIAQFNATKWQDVAVCTWAALTLDLPEKAFSFSSTKLNTVPYADLTQFYRAPDLQERLAAALPLLEGEFPSLSKGPVILAGASGDYAEIFAEDLITTALKQSPDLHFHLHVMDRGHFDPAKALAHYPPGRVSYTIARTNGGDKTPYSTHRFLRLSQFLTATDQTFLVLDIDSIFNGNPAAFIDQLGAFDAAIYLRTDQPFVSQMAAAGVFVARPTEAGRDFVNFIASYILAFESRGESKWFVDQLALISAYTWFRKNVPNAAIAPLPHSAIDWSEGYKPTSLIWTQKGGEKRKIVRSGPVIGSSGT